MSGPDQVDRGDRAPANPPDLERALSRVLTVGVYLSVLLLAVGVGAMVIAGRSPLETGFAPFDPGRLPADVAAGRPEVFLWLGLVVAIAAPVGRVAGALVGFAARREASLVAVAAAILAVIATGVVLALGAA